MYWAHPHELRAMTQYLREPVLVLDVNCAGDAHMQRYMYKDYRLSNGDDHETGYYEAYSDTDARDYLHGCWAEGDPSYAAVVPDSYVWKDSINELGPEDGVPMESINNLSNTDDVNRLLAKRLAIREW
ncbi:hypothetical protein PHMEG_00018435 [Phytophthora megakarya]|uniref:Uncharacterized protein n=1 Tax=Phytophthora megakarya TaxID=4795 RepID=A0A225VUX2_9STRA|nr:hypothetical protein PHMEG_00018435 [Phytophthora megakarya]